jgi:hypothetical protein
MRGNCRVRSIKFVCGTSRVISIQSSRFLHRPTHFVGRYIRLRPRIDASHTIHFANVVRTPVGESLRIEWLYMSAI